MVVTPFLMYLFCFQLLSDWRKSTTLVILLVLPAGGAGSPSFLQPICCFSPLTVILILFLRMQRFTHYDLLQCMDWTLEWLVFGRKVRNIPSADVFKPLLNPAGSENRPLLVSLVFPKAVAVTFTVSMTADSQYLRGLTRNEIRFRNDFSPTIADFFR